MLRFLQAKVGAKIPRIDKRVNHLIKFTSNYQIDDKLIGFFEESFKAIADQLEQEHLLEKKRQPITCITLNTSTYSFEVQDDVYGIITVNAVYPTYKWRGFTDIQIYTCIIEELCHFFWEIVDELEITFKVYEIVKRIKPNVKMKELYQIEWIERELKRQNKTWDDFNCKE